MLVRNIGAIAVQTKQDYIPYESVDAYDNYNISDYGNSGSPVVYPVDKAQTPDYSAGSPTQYPVDPVKNPIDGGQTGDPVIQELPAGPTNTAPPPVVNTAVVADDKPKGTDITGLITLGTLATSMVYPQRKKSLGLIPRLGFVGGLVVLYYILRNREQQPASNGR